MSSTPIGNVVVNNEWLEEARQLIIAIRRPDRETALRNRIFDPIVGLRSSQEVTNYLANLLAATVYYADSVERDLQTARAQLAEAERPKNVVYEYAQVDE